MAVLITNKAYTDFSWLHEQWGREIRRIFLIYNVSETVMRGGHRHRKCRMALTCQTGTVHIYIQTPEADQHFRLDSPGQTLLVSPTDWRVMYNFSTDANLLVFADQHFCDTTYIDTPYRVPEINPHPFGSPTSIQAHSILREPLSTPIQGSIRDKTTYPFNDSNTALKSFVLIALFCLATLWTSAQEHPPAPAQFPTTSATYARAKFAIQPIPSEANTWGFEIYVDGKRFIRQASIPSLPGNRGFATQDKAQKAAQLMVDKLRNGQMPPSLTKEEMQKANVL